MLFIVMLFSVPLTLISVAGKVRNCYSTILKELVENYSWKAVEDLPCSEYRQKDQV